MKLYTILFLRREKQLLLAMKKRGFGTGKWNGVGGKIELGETPEHATIRECQEEIRVIPTRLRRVADIIFYETREPKEAAHRVYIFIADSWQGEPQETEEMRPHWFSDDRVPYHDMWPVDRLWLPAILQGLCYMGEFTTTDAVPVDHRIVEVSEALLLQPDPLLLLDKHYKL